MKRHIEKQKRIYLSVKDIDFIRAIQDVFWISGTKKNGFEMNGKERLGDGRLFL